MITAIPIIYQDSTGNIETTILNDGETLSIELAGIQFASSCLDDFVASPVENLPKRFTINERQELINCRMSCRIPIILNQYGQDYQCTLIVNLDLETNLIVPRAAFGLSANGQTFWTNPFELFEGGLAGLIRQLPAG